jgi:hypothetical protein
MTTTTIPEPSDAARPRVHPIRVALVALGVGGLLVGAFALGRVTGDTTSEPAHVTPTTVPATIAPRSSGRGLVAPVQTDDDDHCRVGKPC